MRASAILDEGMVLSAWISSGRTMPATIRPMQAMRTTSEDSPNSMMPSATVPIVPMPVHTA